MNVKTKKTKLGTLPDKKLRSNHVHHTVKQELEVSKFKLNCNTHISSSHLIDRNDSQSSNIEEINNSGLFHPKNLGIDKGIIDTDKELIKPMEEIVKKSENKKKSRKMKLSYEIPVSEMKNMTKVKSILHTPNKSRSTVNTLG